MEIAYQLYQLAFKHPFALATGTRTHTPSVLVKIKQDNFTGYGEATLPPYLPETQQSVIDFLFQFKFTDIHSTLDFEKAIEQVQRPPSNFFAKAALDIALHDLWAKMNNIPVSRLVNMGNEKTPYCTYTIGMGSPEKIKEKVKEAEGFHILKVKLGGENDRQIIETIRKLTDKPICIDANQGWKKKEDALEMIDWLSTKNVLFIEQPLPKDEWDNAFWLKEKSPLPVIADEALQTIGDLDNASKCYHGINIKLMKCGGISQAKLLLEKATSLHLKILIGCMSESSCGVAAAASTQSKADWVDLDGPLLISNDPFEKTNYVDGKIILNNIAGLGITAKSDNNYITIQ